jgi:hypothetical protein
MQEHLLRMTGENNGNTTICQWGFKLGTVPPNLVNLFHVENGIPPNLFFLFCTGLL